MCHMTRKTKVFGAAAARRRALETLPVPAPPVSEAEQSERAAHQAVVARMRYHLLEERAIKHGRSGGVSWDTLGRWLGCPGETLRRRYADEVGE